MIKDNYQYVMDLFRMDGSAIGAEILEVDWEPALECCHFQGVRSGKLPANLNYGPSVISPIWDNRLGSPYISGFQVEQYGGEEGKSVSGSFPLQYFDTMARRIASLQIKKGALQEYFLKYRISAYCKNPSKDGGGKISSINITVEEIDTPIPLGDQSLQELVARARFVSENGQESGANKGSMPVFIGNSLIDELCRRATGAGAMETGGILIGRLHRDTTSTEIFAEITAEIPATHARSELHSLSFTAKTWTAVNNALSLRARYGEMILGWWHSHSYAKETCKDCKRLKERGCHATAVFMSDDDCLVQRAAFSRAFNTALVIGENPCKGQEYGLFGWHAGSVAKRPFYII